jgi:hypothetical protein
VAQHRNGLLTHLDLVYGHGPLECGDRLEKSGNRPLLRAPSLQEGSLC